MNLEKKPKQKRLVWLLIIMIVLGGILVYQLNVKQVNAQDVVNNQAQATWKDSAGASYGPILSNIVSTNVTAAPAATFAIACLLESHKTHQSSAVVTFYSAGTSNQAGAVNVSTNSAGASSGITTPSAVVSGQRYDIVLKPAYCLSKKLSNILWPSSSALSFGTLLSGDLNNDNTINTFDWSVMNSKWRTANIAADINQDGIVNTIDWGVLNKNWWVSGQ